MCNYHTLVEALEIEGTVFGICARKKNNGQSFGGAMQFGRGPCRWSALPLIIYFDCRMYTSNVSMPLLNIFHMLISTSPDDTQLYTLD